MQKVDVRNLAKLSVLYVLSLVTAVACGEAFAPKDLTDTRLKAMQGGGTPGGDTKPTDTSGAVTETGFRPEIKSVQLKVLGSIGALQLYYTVLDGTQEVPLSTNHKGDDSSTATEKVGEIEYTIQDLCTDHRCTEIIALISKKDASGKILQSSVRLTKGLGESLVAASYKHDTKFEKPADAIAALNEPSATTEQDEEEGLE